MVQTEKRIEKKGQIHLPKSFIDHFGIEPSDSVIVEVVDTGILIKPFSKINTVRDALERHKNRLKSVPPVTIRLGDLENVSLEEEFDK